MAVTLKQFNLLFSKMPICHISYNWKIILRINLTEGKLNMYLLTHVEHYEH